MRNLFLIAVVLFMTGFVSGQSWKDSLRLGKQYYQEGNYKQAYQSLLEAQKLAPDGVDLSKDIGNAAYRSQDFEMAEKAYRAAAANGEDNIVQSKNWHNVGNSQMQSKNYQAAVESYKNALRKNPSDDKARYNLAEAQRRAEQQEKQEQNQNQDQNENEEKDGSENDEHQGNPSDNQGDENQNQDNQNENSGGNSNTSHESEGKLSDKKTDRMLEDLLKKEMETKRKVRGMESGGNKQQVKSGKRW